VKPRHTGETIATHVTTTKCHPYILNLYPGEVNKMQLGEPSLLAAVFLYCSPVLLLTCSVGPLPRPNGLLVDLKVLEHETHDFP
jgi:hypothetical protein